MGKFHPSNFECDKQLFVLCVDVLTKFYSMQKFIPKHEIVEIQKFVLKLELLH